MIPNRMTRPGTPTAESTPPVVTVGSPKPVPSECRPASSRNGSIEEKFGWLNTFTIDMCQTTLKVSLTLTVLNNEKLPIFVLASRTLLRATLPKGVPNTVFAPSSE